MTFFNNIKIEASNDDGTLVLDGSGDISLGSSNRYEEMVREYSSSPVTVYADDSYADGHVTVKMNGTWNGTYKEKYPVKARRSVTVIVRDEDWQNPQWVKSLQARLGVKVGIPSSSLEMLLIDSVKKLYRATWSWEEEIERS